MIGCARTSGSKIKRPDHRTSMRKLFLFALAAIFISGVVAVRLYAEEWSMDYQEGAATRVYNRGYDKVFGCVIDAIQDRGYVVLTLDKENGIIITDYRSDDDIMDGRVMARLDINVRKIDENSTRVVLNIHCERSLEYYNFADVDNLIDEDSYSDVFSSIDNAINKEE